MGCPNGICSVLMAHRVSKPYPFFGDHLMLVCSKTNSMDHNIQACAE